MYFLNIFCTAERKRVIFQRPGHMGSYYGWTLINWPVRSKAGYTFITRIIQHIF